MKTIDIMKASKSLGEYAKELSDEIIVITSKEKPVAALVSLKDVDADSLALSSNQRFLAIIERSHEQFRLGQTRTLAQMKREFRKRKSHRKPA